MGFKDAIGFFFSVLPAIRTIWRWLLERRMEIEMHAPHCHPKGLFPIPCTGEEKPIYSVCVGPNPSISIWLDLLLINHKTDQKERIIGGDLHLKKKNRIFWRKTIAKAPVEYLIGRDKYSLVSNIELEPLSEPRVLTMRAEGSITEPIESLPRKMKLVLEFRMVGPMRRKEYIVADISHDPKILVNHVAGYKPNEEQEPLKLLDSFPKDNEAITTEDVKKIFLKFNKPIDRKTVGYISNYYIRRNSRCQWNICGWIQFSENDTKLIWHVHERLLQNKDEYGPIDIDYPTFEIRIGLPTEDWKLKATDGSKLPETIIRVKIKTDTSYRA